MTNIYRVRTSLAGGSGSSQLSTHYFSTGGILDAQSAASAVRAFWNDIKGVISSSYTMQVEPEVFELDQATGQPWTVHSTINSVVTGTSSADALPWQTQGLIRWQTGIFVNGRQVRGHTYVPGPTETFNDAGVPNATYVASVLSGCLTLVGATDADPVVWSRKNGTSHLITGYSVWGKWAHLSTRRD